MFFHSLLLFVHLYPSQIYPSSLLFLFIICELVICLFNFTLNPAFTVNPSAQVCTEERKNSIFPPRDKFNVTLSLSGFLAPALKLIPPPLSLSLSPFPSLTVFVSLPQTAFFIWFNAILESVTLSLLPVSLSL